MRRVVFVLILLSILATTAHAMGGGHPPGGGGLPGLRAAVETNAEGVAENSPAIAALETALAELADRVADLETQPAPEVSPQLLWVDADGKIVRKFVGPVSEEILESVFSELLPPG